MSCVGLRTHIPAAGSYPNPTTRSAQLGPPGTPMYGIRSIGTAPKKLCFMLRVSKISWAAISGQVWLYCVSWFQCAIAAPGVYRQCDGSSCAVLLTHWLKQNILRLSLFYVSTLYDQSSLRIHTRSPLSWCKHQVSVSYMLQNTLRFSRSPSRANSWPIGFRSPQYHIEISSISFSW